MGTLTRLVLVAVFGGVGSALRYLVSGWCQKIGDGTFPYGTLVVNVVGCLLIGFCGAFFSGPSLTRPVYRLAIMVGLLGGFTTFSSFGLETLSLADDGDLRRALANVLLNNGLGLVAVWAGQRAGVSLFGV